MTCKAELHIGDDYGDNRATMRCQLEENHEGKHQEHFRKDKDDSSNGTYDVLVTWEGNDADGC